MAVLPDDVARGARRARADEGPAVHGAARAGGAEAGARARAHRRAQRARRRRAAVRVSAFTLYVISTSRVHFM